MYNSTPNHVRNRYRTFSKRTSFHGFREISESRTWAHKTFWIGIMAGCTAMLVYHVQIQVRQYLTGSTITKITELSPDEPYPYPAVWIGFFEWQWLDMTKIEQLGISYEEMQMAKSRFGAQPYESPLIPPEEAERRLEARMRSMNSSGIIDFFVSLSLENLNSSQPRTHFLFIDFYPPNAFAILNLTNASATSSTRVRTAIIDINANEFEENVFRLSQYFKTASPLANDTSRGEARFPYLLNVGSGQAIELEPGKRHSVSVDTKVYRNIRQCRDDMDGDVMYLPSTCDLDCAIQVNVNRRIYDPCYPYVPLSGIDMTQSFRNGSVRLCRSGVVVNESLVMREIATARTLSEAEIRDRDAQLARCKSQCIRQCQRVMSMWSVSSSSLVEDLSGEMVNENVSTISVHIPDQESVVIFEEVQQYEWHDMVSDLGGLLGLWLGASMMSLFQILHLCCCAEEKRR